MGQPPRVWWSAVGRTLAERTPRPLALIALGGEIETTSWFTITNGYLPILLWNGLALICCVGLSGGFPLSVTMPVS